MARMREYALLGLVSIFLLGVAPAHAAVIKAAGDSFWDTGMRLCDVDANGDCHTSSYAWSVARFGFGGLAAAILTLLLLLLFLPIRFLCNGFGGTNPSFGVCPSRFEKTRVYTRTQILSVKIIIGFLLIPIVIAVAIGFQANTEISNSIEDITLSLVQSGDKIRNDLVQTRDVVLTISNDSNVQSILNNAVGSANDVSNRLHDAHDTADKYDNVRQALMIVGFVLSVVMIVLGIICAIFNLRVIAMIIGIFGLIGLVIIWLCFGVHLVADKFTYDVCVDIDLLTSNDTAVSNSTSAFKTGPLARLWACDNNTELVALQNFVDTSITEAANSVCNTRAQVCYNATNNSGNPDFQCQFTPACNRDTLTVVTDAQHMQINDNGQMRSLSDCATSCTNNAYRNASLVIVNGIALYNNYTGVYYNTLLPILNCQIAVNVLLQVRDPLCNGVFDSLYGVAVTSLIIGIFYVPFIILMIIGFKRFQSLNGGIV